MNSSAIKIVTAVILSAALWMGGVLIFGGTIGMLCVMLAIAISGYVAGKEMDTPCTTSTLKH